jgi:glycosyltransferase involved in cell wall biosynthesis
MRVCFVVNKLSYFLSHRFDLGKRIAREHNFILITDLKGMTDQEKAMLENNNIQTLHLSQRAKINGWADWFRYLRGLQKILGHTAPKYIFYVTLELSMIGSLLHNFIGGQKSFFIITGLEHHLVSNTIKMMLRRMIQKISNLLLYLRKDHLFIFQNHDDRKLFIAKNMAFRKKTQVISGNGVNENIFKFVRRSKEDQLIFLFSSRLLISKGIREFISASKVLTRKYPDIVFRIAGQFDSNDPQGISKKYFDELRQTIEYVGEKQPFEMPEMLSQASVFVLPSYGEGLPKAALEAGLTGLPLIMANVPGCRDCLDGDKNGFLVTTGDVEDLVVKMEILITDPELRQRQGVHSRAFIAEYFSNDVIQSKYLKLINAET